MNPKQQLSPRSAIIIGSLFSLAGVSIMLVGLGIIPVDPSSFNAPHWMVTCAGIAFALGGAAIINGYGFGSIMNPDGSLKQDASPKAKLRQNILGISIVSMMTIMTGWISFGPGERNFTTNIPFLDNSPYRDLIGRIGFGIGFAVLLLFLVYAIKNILKKNPPDTPQP